MRTKKTTEKTTDTRDEQTAFNKDLIAIIKKHGIGDYAFIGEHGDGVYEGLNGKKSNVIGLITLLLDGVKGPKNPFSRMMGL